MVSYTINTSMCSWPTKDAGKSCTDSKQCEGICNPPPSATKGRGIAVLEGDVVGVCSATQLPTKRPNCEAYIENGRMKLAACFD